MGKRERGLALSEQVNPVLSVHRTGPFKLSAVTVAHLQCIP